MLEPEAAHNFRHNFISHELIETGLILAQIAFEQIASDLYTLFTLLGFNPVTDTVACLGGLDQVEPILARSLSAGSENLHHIAILEWRFQSHHFAVYLGSDAGISHITMN